jgi:hypothetical protein
LRVSHECILNYDLYAQELIEKAEKQPIITIGVLVSIVVVILTVFLKLIFGGKKVSSLVLKRQLAFLFSAILAAFFVRGY